MLIKKENFMVKLVDFQRKILVGEVKSVCGLVLSVGLGEKLIFFIDCKLIGFRRVIVIIYKKNKV